MLLRVGGPPLYLGRDVIEQEIQQPQSLAFPIRVDSPFGDGDVQYILPRVPRGFRTPPNEFLEEGAVEARGFPRHKVLEGLAVHGANDAVGSTIVKGSNKITTALTNGCKGISRGCAASLRVQILENGTDINRFILAWVLL